MQRFQGGLVFKAHRLLYHLTPDLRVIQRKKKVTVEDSGDELGALGRQLGDQVRVVLEELLSPCRQEVGCEMRDQAVCSNFDKISGSVTY